MNPTDGLVDFFERFSPQDVARLGDWYCADATFKDPFNDVRGLPAIKQVYEHMFATLDRPRFLVVHHIGDEEQGWLRWEFSFVSKAQAQVVHGATHVLYDRAGRIRIHRDYWDPAEELYEKVPLLGALLRWIKRRLSAPQPPGR